MKFRKILLCVLVLNIFCVYTLAQNVDNEERIAQLEKVKGNMDYNKYLGEAFRMLMDTPEDYEIMAAVADAFYSAGSLDRAIFVYERILSENPTNETLKNRINELQTELAGLEAKIDDLRNTLYQNSGDKKTHHSLISILMGLKRSSEARQAINSAKSKFKNDPIISMLSSVYESKIALPAKHSIKLAALAVDKYKEGNIKEAYTLIDNALSLSFVSPFVFDKYATIMLNEKKYKSAERCMEESLKINWEESKAFNLGNLCLYLKEYGRALGYYSQMLERNEKLPKVLFNMGICMSAVGDAEGAKESFKKAFELKPDLKNEKEKGGKSYIMVNGIRLEL